MISIVNRNQKVFETLLKVNNNKFHTRDQNIYATKFIGRNGASNLIPQKYCYPISKCYIHTKFLYI